jgi:hypothetical protein
LVIYGWKTQKERKKKEVFIVEKGAMASFLLKTRRSFHDEIPIVGPTFLVVFGFAGSVVFLVSSVCFLSWSVSFSQLFSFRSFTNTGLAQKGARVSFTHFRIIIVNSILCLFHPICFDFVFLFFQFGWFRWCLSLVPQ